MRLKLVTVAFNRDFGAFPEDPLQGVEGEIVSVVEHFFSVDGIPHLLLVVQHRDADATTPLKGRKSRRGPDLSDEETAVFEKLRAWRNGRAEADGVPPYVVASNAELAGIARRRPATIAVLREVDGIGEGKAARYGTDILALLSDGQAPGGA